MSNFQLFQNTYRKYFSWNLFLLKSQILDCKPETLEKKAQFCKDLFKVFKILEYPLFSGHFQRICICIEAFSPVVSCRLSVFLQFYKKRTPLHEFFWIFAKVFHETVSRKHL